MTPPYPSLGSGHAPALDPERLLEHAGWMRQLARHLVGDRDRAEDLTQETWLRALESPPGTGLPLRAWLRVVMRNLLRREHRAAARRTDRERRSAAERPTAAEDAPATLARAAAHRSLLQAVLELEEPYRTTLLLRYFEELPPRRIAQRTGTPVATVKTRLARGLERLRVLLRAEHRDASDAWLLALVPVLRPPTGGSLSGLSLPSVARPSLSKLLPASIGTLVVNAKLISVSLLAAAAVGTGYLLLEGPLPDSGPGLQLEPPLARSAVPEPAPPLPVETTEPGAEASTGPERVALAAVPTPNPEAPAAAPLAPLVRGRVVDLEGRGVADLEVVAQGAPEDAQEPVRSGADGRFELRVERAQRLSIREGEWIAVLTAVPMAAPLGKEPLIVVAPRLRLAGLAIDETGGAVAGARVALELPQRLRTELDLVLDYSSEVPFEVEVGADGRFVLAAAPSLPGGVLVARAAGFEPARVPAPVFAREELVLQLRRPTSQVTTLHGFVVDPAGAPVADALVSLGLETARSDEEGRFAFALDDPESMNARFVEVNTTRLQAVAPGHRPARLEVSQTDAAGRPLWPDPIVLRLGPPPLALEGRVVDARDEPLAGMRVWLEDPTTFGGVPVEDGRRRLSHVETELGGLDRGWPFVVTDEAGRFRLEGLLDRPYTLAAMDPETLLRERRTVQPGGGDVELRLDLEEATYAVLRGHIVDGSGAPVAGASVRTSCDAFRTRVSGQIVGTRHSSGPNTSTDAQGSFELRRVPRNLAYLRIDHPDTIPLEWGRDEQALEDLVGDDPHVLTIVVMRRCHFRVELESAEVADEIAILDPDGEPLTISEFQGTSRRDGPRASIENGRTALLAVGDRAATLVLYRDGVELRRTAIALEPGDRPTLRP